MNEALETESWWHKHWIYCEGKWFSLRSIN